ncbi:MULTISPECIES: GcvT family protein [unclassified Rhizobium]|uniref:GcvT family protein n=1 Tax=unclassified Rhizobium TaxID=2613769 RepID=UPI0007142813|nr:MULTISPECIES: FAD-dependent oxidoreductase [unclassified Rhizobium]KQS97794.1 dimethylglycine dehydrogenase [Rhizobium sp. Leaf386]KQT00052.1 dimethylglycine dehydrogenase [Rhizobium sp. Leaf391]KQT97057.1 dimethylglycine dehydrogenase [Rhizobium sp. Leaf453]
MSNLPSHARVVIIGGGAVGASALYHLAKAGWTDCVLLEKNELTAGSTWHAAGNVPTFSSSWSIMNMQRYSASLYRELGDLVDYPMNYHVTGSIRLGHSKERLQEFKRVVGMGRYQGMDLDILSPDEMRGKYPFLETHDLTGALYDPYDGDIDPAQLTQALAKGARDMGAKIFRFCPATGARREGEEWVISTPQGEIRCEKVVNAAGYYAREVGKWFGRDVPMMVMSHQYMLFEEIPELAAWSREAGHKLPLLRDVDSSYYLRQEKTGMNLGPYERNCKAHWVTPDDPMPDDFSFQLFPDDLDRLEWYLNDAVERVPILGTAGLSRMINGPIPYAPDGNPLIGPMPGVPNAFEACVFTFGICQAGGAGKVLAEWVTEGETEWDMWSCDPRRYTSFAADKDYCIAKGMEIYGHEYAMHFPKHAWPAGRDQKLSPIHDRIKALGAQFKPYNGWERANWYAAPGDDLSEQSTQTWNREGPWRSRIEAECRAVTEAAGILDLPGFSRFRVKGEGATAWLSSLITGKVPKPGRIGLAYFSDDKGRIVTEMSVMMLDEDFFFLITAATAQWHDFEWLQKHLPKDAVFTIDDVTESFSCQILSGPNSRAILAEVTDADLQKGWLTHQSCQIAGRWCQLVRVSFAGELGWEIHTKVEDTATIFDAVWEAGQKHGLKPFGMEALDSLRIEKSYRAWKGDLSTDYTILQGGLDRFVDWTKPDFKGKAALEREKQQDVSKRFVTLTVEAGECDAPYMSTLWHDGKVVGETTSGNWGYRVGKSIALGMLRADLTAPGTEIEVEIYGDRFKATVQPDGPLFDPNNERLRA